MKFGIRKPSIKKSFAAKTSVKRYIRHNIGVKAPKGLGYITNRPCHKNCVNGRG